jgi:hypothetical protein
MVNKTHNKIPVLDEANSSGKNSHVKLQGTRSYLFNLFICVQTGKLSPVQWTGRPNDGMQGCKNPGRQVGPATDFITVATNILAGTQYGTYFTRHFWCLEFGGGSHIFGNILNPWWEEW